MSKWIAERCFLLFYGFILVGLGGSIHREIFTFVRPLKGRYKAKEWDNLVRPVIEKWGKFVNQHM